MHNNLYLKLNKDTLKQLIFNGNVEILNRTLQNENDIKTLLDKLNQLKSINVNNVTKPLHINRFDSKSA